MNYNDFAEKIKVKYPEYSDMDNRELAKKMVAKFPNEYSDVVFDEPKKGIDISPSGLVKQAAAGIAAPIRALTRGETIPEAYKRGREAQEQSALNKLSPVVDIGTYLYLPQANLLKGGKLTTVGNNLLTGGYQGGVIGGIESLKKEGDLSGVGSGSAIGASVTAGLPLGLQAVEKTTKLLPMAGGMFAKALGRIQPETLERAVQPDSIALDLTRPQAQNLLMDTTERVRDTYKRLLAGAGQNVRNVANNLKNIENRINVEDLKGDIKGIFDKYQGDVVNPARNMTGELEQGLNRLVESGTQRPNLIPQAENKPLNFSKEKQEEAFRILSEATGKPINWLKSQLNADTFANGVGARKEFIENLVNNTDDRLANLGNDYFKNMKYYNVSNLDDINAGTEIAERAFDDIANRRFNVNNLEPIETAFNKADNEYNNLINNIISNANDKNIYNTAFAKIENIVKDLPVDAQASYLEKFYNDVANIDKMSNSVSPTDLQKIKEQIGHMVNWSDETAKNYQNPILEQLYGKFNDRLSNLSPELAEVNKEYAKLARFKKNEGLNRILRPTDSIDSASSALKNYNSTVTKGNTNRNIQDLENEFINAGEAPFLKDIDDVNAAMDLLNARSTGDSWLANLATQLTRPALKFARGVNRSGLPEIYERLKLRSPRYLTPLLYGTPTLYGRVTND
jgi:hypothetical protein